MTLFIALASTAAYLIAAWFCALLVYRRARPYTEPLSCVTPSLCRCGSHSESCYARPGFLIYTKAGAAAVALGLGSIWPLLLLAFGFVRGVPRMFTPGDRPLPEEVAAKIGRLERELWIGKERKPYG